LFLVDVDTTLATAAITFRKARESRPAVPARQTGTALTRGGW
jgi:hypothetical protein